MKVLPNLREEIKEREKQLKILRKLNQAQYEILRIEADPEFDKWIPLVVKNKKIGYTPLFKRNMLVSVEFPSYGG